MFVNITFFNFIVTDVTVNQGSRSGDVKFEVSLR